MTGPESTWCELVLVCLELTGKAWFVSEAVKFDIRPWICGLVDPLRCYIIFRKLFARRAGNSYLIAAI
jgi:hypothetical protein